MREARDSEGIDNGLDDMIYAAHEPTPQAPHARNQQHATERWNDPRRAQRC